MKAWLALNLDSVFKVPSRTDAFGAIVDSIRDTVDAIGRRSQTIATCVVAFYNIIILLLIWQTLACYLYTIVEVPLHANTPTVFLWVMLSEVWRVTANAVLGIVLAVITIRRTLYKIIK